MAKIRHLERAPIVEALVDYKVTLPSDYPVEKLRSAAAALKDEYPIVEEQRMFRAQVHFGPQEPSAKATTTALGQRGFFFKSADQVRLAQFRRDGFTFNRLAPYTTWTDLRDESLRLWELYRSIAEPERLERIALRYLNRLMAPPRGELKEFLQIEPPEIPGMPKTLATFLMRLSAFDPETHYLSNVTMALEKDADPTRSVILIDIEAYTDTGLGLSREELTPILERLHQMKNEIFFASITEETARKYGG